MLFTTSSFITDFCSNIFRKCDNSQHKLDSKVGGGAQDQRKIYCIYGIFKSNWNLSETDSENEAADFPRFIVIESLEEACLAKFTPFLIEKVISTRASLKTVTKTRNGNMLGGVDSRRQTESIFKIKTFLSTKCRAYPHEKLNTSKEVIRSRELTLATEEDIASAWGNRELQI